MRTKNFLKITTFTTLISLLLIPLASIFAQTETQNNGINVPVYQKIKPLIKENTFIVAYIDVDKIDLDAFVAKVSPRVEQFIKIHSQKVRELTKSDQPETTGENKSETKPESTTETKTTEPATTETKTTEPTTTETKTTEPATTETKTTEPATTETKTAEPTTTETKTTEPTTTETKTAEPATTDVKTNGQESGDVAVPKDLDVALSSTIAVEMGNAARQAVSEFLTELRANGIKEFYILSTMEIVQQCPAMIAVHGKVDLKPELKVKLESVGIHLVPGLLGGCTIFAVDPQSAQQQTETIDNPNPDPNNPQPENPVDPNLPNPNSPNPNLSNPNSPNPNLPNPNSPNPNLPNPNLLNPNLPNPNSPNPNLPNPNSPNPNLPNPNSPNPNLPNPNLPLNPSHPVVLPRDGMLGNGFLGKPVNNTTDKYTAIVEIFKRLKIKDRSEIKSGLHIQRNAPIRVVFAPSSGMKSMANMFVPLAAGAAANVVPEAAESTKQSIDVGLKILGKLQSVSIGFIPENIRLNFAIEFKTEQEAQDTYALIEKYYQAAKTSVIADMKKIYTNLSPEQLEKMAKLNNKLIDIFTPQLRKHRILHSVTEKVIDNTINTTAELMAEGSAAMIISSNKFSATNNAKAIVLAFHNYQEVHGTLPPLYTVDAAGKPLHSWRVLILPFLDKQDLYDKIKLDEAWDSEHNKQFHNAIIPAYRTKNSATDQNDNKTCNFVTIIGSPMKAKDGTSLSDIPDGTSNTAATVELKESFCWMDPTKNITVEEFSKPLDGKEVLIGGSQEGGVIVGFWDGSVRIIPNKTPTEALKAIATANGGESTAIQ